MIKKLLRISVLFAFLGLLFTPPGIAAEFNQDIIRNAPLSPEFLNWQPQRDNKTISNNNPNGENDEEEVYHTGYIPSPIDRSHLEDNPPKGGPVRSVGLPSSYDIRNNGWVPAIRNQNPYGTCWAHAATGALESNYLAKKFNSDVDLSEFHLAYFVYGDSRPGKSFTKPDPSDGILDQGGNIDQAVAFFARLSGPVDESLLPYPGYSWSAPSGYPEDYTPLEARLLESYSVGRITQNNRDTIKKFLMEYGAVNISYYAGEGATSHYGTSTTYYYNPTQSANHAVLIVGWDDNVSREKFTSSSSLPNSDGAWLVRNSWGEDWGDEGYFYMSYEQYITNATVLIAGKPQNNLKQYGYDDLGYTSTSGYYDTTAYGANIFKITGDDEILKQVAFYTTDNNAKYEVAVYDLGWSQPSSPTNGNKISSTSGSFTYSGYHTVDVPEVAIEKNKYFSVVVKFVNSSYSYPLAVESVVYWSTGEKYSDPVVNSGESYMSSDGSYWSDTYSSNKNVCIKAFTVDKSNSDQEEVQILTTSLKNATVGVEYNEIVEANLPNLIWLVTPSINVPSWLTYQANSDRSALVLGGTPDTPGSYTFRINAGNAQTEDMRTFTLIVNEATSDDEDVPDRVHLYFSYNANADLVNGHSSYSHYGPSPDVYITTYLSKRYDYTYNSTSQDTKANQLQNGIRIPKKRDTPYIKLKNGKIIKNKNAQVIEKTPKELLKASVFKNAFTISSGAGNYAYRDTYYGTGYTVVPSYTEKTFDLINWYNTYEPYENGYYMSLFCDGADEAFKNRTFSWKLPGAHSKFNGSVKITNLYSVIDQLNSAVPYCKLINQNSNGEYTAIEWSLVKANNTSKPITPNFDGSIGIYMLVKLEEEGAYYTYHPDFISIESGKTASGVVELETPVKLIDIYYIDAYLYRYDSTYYNVDGYYYTIPYHWSFYNQDSSESDEEAPVINTTGLPDAQVGEEYEEYIDYSGTSPITWTLTGILPNGLYLDSSEGKIYGTPKESGQFAFRINASNSYGSDFADLIINVTGNGSIPSKVNVGLFHQVVTGFDAAGKSSYDDADLLGLNIVLDKVYNDSAKSNNIIALLKKFDAIDREIIKVNSKKASSDVAKTANKATSRLKEVVDGATLTVNRGNSYSYSLEDYDEEFTIDVSQNVQKVFDIAEPEEYENQGFYYLVDTEYDEYNQVRFLSEEALKNRKLSWKFTGELSKLTNSNAKVTNFRTVNDQLKGVVPYVALIKNLYGEVTAIQWRFVKTSNTSQAVAPGFNTQVSIGIFTTDNDEGNYVETGYNVGSKEIPDRIAYFNEPVSIDEITHIKFYFTDNYVRYVWKFKNRPIVTITSGSNPGSVISDRGNEYKLVLSAEGNFESWGWGSEEDFPEWLGVEENDNELILSGIPEGYKKETNYKLAVTAYGTNGTNTTINLDITVKIPELKKPVIETAKLEDGQYGDDYSMEIKLKEETDVEWTVSGKLPNGIEYFAGNDALDEGAESESSLLLKGSPSETFKGNITILASNSKGRASKKYTLNIKGNPPQITTTELPNGKVKSEYAGAEIEVDGDPTMTLTVSGKLPNGMNFDTEEDGNTIKGVLSGTPEKAGKYNLTFKAANAIGSTTKKLVLEINDAIQITTNKLNKATQGKSFSAKLKIKGAKSATWSWEFDDNEDGFNVESIGLEIDSDTGTIKGTPTIPGEFTFTVYADAGDDNIAEQQFTLTVQGNAPKISKTNLPKGYVDLNGENDEYEGSIIAANTVNGLDWEIENLPEGLDYAVDDDDEHICRIFGYPQEAFNANISITVYNKFDLSKKATKKVKLTINPAKPVILDEENSELTEGFKGEVYDGYQFEVSEGTGKVSWSWSGAPSGLKINKNTGEITGKPTKVGTFNPKVTVKNSSGSDSKSFVIVINQPNDEAKPLTDDNEKSQYNEVLDNSESENLSDDVKTETLDSDETDSLDKATANTISVDITVGGESTITVNGDTYLVIAKFSEIQVQESAQYDFNVELAENAPVNKELFWFATPNTASSEENDDEIVEFADETGQEISSVPENRKIIVSPWLNAGFKYEPIIAVKSE